MRRIPRVLIIVALALTSAVGYGAVSPTAASADDTPVIATDASPEWIVVDNVNDIAYVVESHRSATKGHRAWVCTTR